MMILLFILASRKVCCVVVADDYIFCSSWHPGKFVFSLLLMMILLFIMGTEVVIKAPTASSWERPGYGCCLDYSYTM